jgi:hypothetical protein
LRAAEVASSVAAARAALRVAVREVASSVAAARAALKAAVRGSTATALKGLAL